MAFLNTEKDSKEKTFEHTWEIKNFKNVMESETLIDNTTTEVQCEENDVVYAKFLVGLKLSFYASNRVVRFYWKLLQQSFCLDDVQACLAIDSFYGDGTNWFTFKSEVNAIHDKAIDINAYISAVPSKYGFSIFTNSEGSWINKLKITLKFLPDQVDACSKEEFRLAYNSEFIENMTALINNELGSDVKILTKDNKELFAHKAFLCAQCPVFVSMFGSNFLERSTGVVNVDDISAKTMKVLLHFWYTGELLPSWKDDDTVVEFTYAAGKYQMNQVLKMLDEILMQDLKGSDANIELLRVVEQLSLKNAEARILKLVVHKINQATNGTELLAMFSLTTDNFNEKNLTFSQILKACDDVLSENNEKQACSSDIELMALASKNGVKNVENKLLARIIDTINKVDSADKLFAIFDVRNEEEDDVSEARDMLVRAALK